MEEKPKTCDAQKGIRERAKSESLGNKMHKKTMDFFYTKETDLSKQTMNENNNSRSLMGPIVRRKKVLSMPLGSNQTEFFYNAENHPQLAMEQSPFRRTSPAPSSQPDFMTKILRRKQVSLDLLAPQHSDFFHTPRQDDVEMSQLETVHDAPELGEEYGRKDVGFTDDTEEHEKMDNVKLFKPLVFAPYHVTAGNGGHGGHGGPAPESIDAETKNVVKAQTANMAEMRKYLLSLKGKITSIEKSKDPEMALILREAENALNMQSLIDKEQRIISEKITGTATDQSGEIENGQGGEDGYDEENTSIIRATRKDVFMTIILAVIMASLTGVILGWKTHLSEEYSIFGKVGLACTTPCYGDIHDKDFFLGHNHFGPYDVIDVETFLDPAPHAKAPTSITVHIIGVETNTTKSIVELGPADAKERKFYHKRVLTETFDHPEEHHVMNVFSTETSYELSFSLHGTVLEPVAKNSVIIAAVMMIVVYIFILLEVIHRTLVAVFGSLMALFIYYIMHDGHVESIATVMLHMEWSTLGLLFGMMLIVGELSHTGVFEWCAVRLMLASKGSFMRLIILLNVLTAVASAFLDNVTTMLLLAPVTIDMCNILNVDPRPYLIGEVILSNIGGTATLIGDPPNIIIGSAFQEIGFVDFIINVLPCIFLLCIPVSLAMICWIYRYYLTKSQMPELDATKLKRTYPVYDEPRLLIAGTIALFVILIFFLHPLHHKDTAWVALLGAFMTMAFTNPHDVQYALRNHIEWDTLLFFAGLFILVEVCAHMGLLSFIGESLAHYISEQPKESQLAVAITLIIWVSAVTSAFLDNIPYTATMIPVIIVLAEELDTLPIKTLAWALSFGACLGGNGTLLGASANIVTAGISSSKGYRISFLNFFYPGFIIMMATVAIANLYMLVVYVWI